MRTATVLAAYLLAGGPLVAQSPGTAIRDALRSLTHGWGGCSTEPEPMPVSIAYFPTVHFFRDECIREHGDPTSALVGLDSDSVLYLLQSPSALKFLVNRHPPVGRDSANTLHYARLSLEMAGAIPHQALLVLGATDLPSEASACVQAYAWTSSWYPDSLQQIQLVVRQPVFRGWVIRRIRLLMVQGWAGITADERLWPSEDPC